MQRTELKERDAVELRAEDGTRVTVTRLRPRLLLVQIAGDDRGALGGGPFFEIERQLSRDQPLELFVDLRDAAGATAAVREAWTDWFWRRRAQLSRVSILASSRFVNLTVEIAKLFSRTGELIQIYSDQRLFEQALAVAAGATVSLPPARATAPSPLPGAPPSSPSSSRELVREVLSDRAVRLRGGQCAWLFERLRAGVLLVTVTGHDDGELAAATLDEVNLALGRLPLALFIDARQSPSASPAASAPWTDWFASNRGALKRVVVLTATRALRLTLAIAGHLSGTHDLLHITDDARAFAAALAEEVPAFSWTM